MTSARADDLAVVRVIDSMAHDFVSAGAPGKVVNFEGVARQLSTFGVSSSGGNGEGHVRLDGIDRHLKFEDIAVARREIGIGNRVVRDQDPYRVL